MSLLTADHRIDASLRLDSGLALRAGVFRAAASQWREEALYPGLKVIVLEGGVDSRIAGRPDLRLDGASLCMVWAGAGVDGADAFDAGREQRYALVTLPDHALWSQLGLDPEQVRHQLGACGSAPLCWHGPAGPQARQVANQLRVCRQRGAAGQLYLAAKGLELIALALACAGNPEPDLVPAARELDAVHHVHRRLLADLRQPPGSDELAREIGVSVRRLNLLFRQAFGQSMAAFLQEQRLLLARDLIVNGAMAVSEAAWHAGYGPAHFSVAFRRRFGCSPVELRVKTRKP